jgi:hypothetical protein
MKKIAKYIFLSSAVYDFTLGLMFILLNNRLFDYLNITRPNHIGYIQFPAALLMIFGIMLYKIYKDIDGNKNLIIYVILLKLAYCSVVFLNLFFNSIPFIWIIFGIIDFIYLVLFIYIKRIYS